jgi:hypothetical protein
MSDEETTGLVGALVLAGLALLSGDWWFILPTMLLAVVCVMCAISVGGGGGVPVYRHEQAALDEIAERLRSIERSQYSD